MTRPLSRTRSRTSIRLCRGGSLLRLMPLSHAITVPKGRRPNRCKSCKLVPSPTIHHVTELTAGKVARKIRVERRGELLGDVGSGDMWSHHDVVECPQGMNRRQRLPRGAAEQGAADAPLAERVDQGGLVHEGAAADVDEPRARLHGAELALADQAARLGGERRDQDHEVALGEGAGELRRAMDAT